MAPLEPCLWMSLSAFEKASLISDAGLGGHGGYDNDFVPWPRLKLVQGLSKGFSAKEPHGEAEAGTGSQPPLWPPVWAPWIPLKILNNLGRGRGFLQLIHTWKCWDKMRNQILFPLQARRATALTPHTAKGWDREGPLRLPHPWGAQPWILPWHLPAGQAFAICQGNGTTHTPVLLLSWCRADFMYSLSLLNRKIQTTSDIPFLVNYFVKYDSFTSFLNRSNIFQHSLRMHLTRS